MNSYNLSRNFWNFSFENPHMVKPNHIALYFFAMEHCNRLGWKKNFGLPTTMSMEAIGIKSYSVYKKTFDELVTMGFFEVLQLSKNQYTSNVIALKEFNKAPDNALDKAGVTHASTQPLGTDESIGSIDKPLNKETIETKELEKQSEVLALFGFNEAPQHIVQQRLVKAFFFVKKTDGTLDHFIEQFDAYKTHILKEENKKFIFNIFNFLGTQEKQFQDGKWQNENWTLRLTGAVVKQLRTVNY